jgi:large subunit ribosomal protein L4
MATAVSYSKTGTKQDATVKLEKAVFGVEPNHELVGQAYRTYLANGRNAHASTLRRGQVQGGGKKPWRQKGTGRARVGSIRVPQWKGGGIVFGPTGSENHTLNLPVRMKRLAIRQALSLQATAGNISVIEAFDATDGRAQTTAKLLTKLRLEGSVALVVATKTDLLERATRNIQGLELVTATYLNVFTVMNADQLVFTADALKSVNEWLGDKK